MQLALFTDYAVLGSQLRYFRHVKSLDAFLHIYENSCNVTVNITIKLVMIDKGELFLSTKRQRPSNMSHVLTELIGSVVSPWLVHFVIMNSFSPIEVHHLMDTRRL